MNRQLVSEIRKKLSAHPTDELVGSYREHNDNQWSEEAFEAMRQIFLERELPIPDIAPKAHEVKIDTAIKDSVQIGSTVAAHKKPPSFRTLGGMLSAIIVGIHLGITGAMIGGVLGYIFLGPVIEVTIERCYPLNVWRGSRVLWAVSHLLSFTLCILMLAVSRIQPNASGSDTLWTYAIGAGAGLFGATFPYLLAGMIKRPRTISPAD
jgi:hypothetical protein